MCRREHDPNTCHLCGRIVRPKSWEDLGLLPPPWDPLVGEIEELVGRAAAERRVLRLELRSIAEDLGLTPDERALAERLMTAYIGAGAREEQRRRDKLHAEAKRKAGGSR